MRLDDISGILLRSLRTRTAWYTLILFPFAAVLFSTRHPFALDDGLRHMVMAGKYASEGVQSAGDWGEYFFAGYFATHIVDPWFLSHVASIPFTLFSDGVFGLKVATLVFLIVLLLSAVCVLKELRLPPVLGLLFLVLLFFGSSTFMERLLVGRPFVLQTALFLFAYISIIKKRYAVLLPLLAVATLLSQLFVFSLFLCLVAVACFCFLRQWQDACRCLMVAITGVAVGLFLHPHSIAYLTYLTVIFFRIPFLRQGIGLGGEMHGGLFGDDVTLLIVVFCLFLLCVLLSRRGAWRQHRLLHRFDVLLSTSLVACFSVMYFLWVRTVDFFWPMMLILVMQLSTVTPQITRDVLGYLHAPAFYFRWRFTWLYLVILVCSVNFFELSTRAFAGDDAHALQTYDAIHTVPASSRVLNVDWDIFPSLLFLNPTSQYARGIDPGFDAYSDPEGMALSEVLLERWRWDWFDLRGSIREVSERYEFPWSFRVLSERSDVDYSLWVQKLRQHYQADFLVLKRSTHTRAIVGLRSVLPVFSESDALVVFDLR